MRILAVLLASEALLAPHYGDFTFMLGNGALALGVLCGVSGYSLPLIRLFPGGFHVERVDQDHEHDLRRAA